MFSNGKVSISIASLTWSKLTDSIKDYTNPLKYLASRLYIRIMHSTCFYNIHIHHTLRCFLSVNPQQSAYDNIKDQNTFKLNMPVTVKIPSSQLFFLRDFFQITAYFREILKQCAMFCSYLLNWARELIISFLVFL